MFEKTYLTDIQGRYHIKGCEVMGELIDVVASCIGGLTNTTKIENTFRTVKGIGVGRNTVKQYLEILEESFLVRKAVRYDVKGRKYIDTPQKYYFEDLGLRNARIGFRQVEKTHLMGNLIYNELCLRGYTVDVVMHNTKNSEGRSRKVQLEVDLCAIVDQREYTFSLHTLCQTGKRWSRNRLRFCKSKIALGKLLSLQIDICQDTKKESGFLA